MLNDLKNIVLRAVKAFYEQDSTLVEDDLCERALTFRIGLQLAKVIEEHHDVYGDVQSEFNKAYSMFMEVTEKSINLPRGYIKDKNYPDLLLFSHDVGNKIIIEIKKLNKLTRNRDLKEDIIKLYAFTHPYVNDYCYPLGVHLILETNAFLAIWFVKGRVQSAIILSYNSESSKWMKKKTSITNSNVSRGYSIQIPEYSITSIKNSFKQL